MNTKTFALLFGIVFLAVGALGFVPGMVHMPPADPHDVTMTQGYGDLLGLFPVNLLHNLVHLLFGVWGLIAAKSLPAAKGYAKSVAIIYAILMVMGLISAGNLHTTFGLIPLYGHDVWLHLGTAILAAYLGWRSVVEIERRAAERVDRREQTIPVEKERRLGHSDRRIPGSEV